jgi:hypothetical protein
MLPVGPSLSSTCSVFKSGAIYLLPSLTSRACRAANGYRPSIIIADEELCEQTFSRSLLTEPAVGHEALGFSQQMPTRHRAGRSIQME